MMNISTSNKTSSNLHTLLTSAENMAVIQYDLQQNALIYVGPVRFVGGMATAVLVMYVERYHGNAAEYRSPIKYMMKAVRKS